MSGESSPEPDLGGINDFVDGRALIHRAIANCKVSLIKRLLESGADANLRATSNDRTLGSTPLHFAAAYCRVDVLRLLIEFGADVDARDHVCQNTPLFNVIGAGLVGDQEKELLCIKVLLDKGASVNTINKLRHTPLYTAAACKKVHIFEYLLGRGADINAVPSLLYRLVSTHQDQILLLMLSHPSICIDFDGEKKCCLEHGASYILSAASDDRGTFLLLLAATESVFKKLSENELAMISSTNKETAKLFIASLSHSDNPDLEMARKKLAVARKIYSARTTKFVQKCTFCQQPGDFACTGCYTQVYCSFACHRQDWPAHRDRCACSPTGIEEPD